MREGVLEAGRVRIRPAHMMGQCCTDSTARAALAASGRAYDEGDTLNHRDPGTSAERSKRSTLLQGHRVTGYPRMFTLGVVSWGRGRSLAQVVLALRSLLVGLIVRFSSSWRNRARQAYTA